MLNYFNKKLKGLFVWVFVEDWLWIGLFCVLCGWVEVNGFEFC